MTDGQYPRAIVVGEIADPHVEAVVLAMKELGEKPVVLDAASMLAKGFTFDSDAAQRKGPARPSRGWIRRLAPAGWSSEVVPSSHAGVIAGSWMALLTGWLESVDVDWVTDLPTLLRAEGKLLQLKEASAIGLDVPRTVVTTQVDVIRQQFVGKVAVKPLGPGQMVDADGNGLALPTTVLDPRDLGEDEVAAAPFFFQEVLAARRHLRVVTVGDQAFSASLDACSLPVDWRHHRDAHDSFVASADPQARASAVRIAHRLGVGFSSQDWIDTGDRLVFLDLNPSGQWLFLPTAAAEPATNALAGWIAGRDR